MDREFRSTILASEQVVSGLVGNGRDGDLLPVPNPAIGAREISPERRRKIERALERHARSIGRRLLLLHLKLKGEYFLFYLRFLALKYSAKLKRMLS